MDLYFKTYGSSDRALIILHGLLGASGNWHTLASKAFAPHFRVFTVDQRNHGRSPHSDEMSYRLMAEDLVEFMDRQDLQQAVILGHSMGGKVAMQFALSYPARTEQLIVADMAPRRSSTDHLEFIEALRSIEPERLGGRQEIDDALARRIPSVPIRQFLLKNLVLDPNTKTYRWQLNLEGIYHNYDALGEAIIGSCPYVGPALFIRGENSDYITDADIPEIKRLFTAAEVVTIPEAGHWVHADAPQAFANAVLAFVS